MSNITIQNYKKLIKEKYELEKNGDNYHYLVQPSAANLRKLCWQKFESNNNQNDLKVFTAFFGFSFDITQKNTFKTKTDRFKPIGSFFRGETESPTDDILEIAAILVDFELRPHNKFRKYYTEEESETEQAKGGHTDNFVTSDVQVPTENGIEKEAGKIEEVKKPATFFLSFTKTFSEQRLKNLKQIIIGVALVFGLGFAISYYLFPKKQCMQWSNDHYEEVSCDLNIQGIGNFNKIVPLDESVFNLKKIKVSEKTTFFKDGEAIVWYAKTANGIDFFNTHGRHPENGHAVKPVTQYIINKYVVK